MAAQRIDNLNGDILVVQTAFLGDVLLGIPLLKILRTKTAGRLVLFCRQGVGAFFLDAKLVDEVIEVNKAERSSWAKAEAAVAGRAFAVVVCPHESFRTARFVSRIDSPFKIGYRRWFNSFAFTHRVRRPLELPEVLRQLSLISPFIDSYAQTIETFRTEQAAAGGQGAGGTLMAVPFGTDMKVPLLMEIRNTRRVGGDAKVSSIVEPFADSRDPVIVLAPGSVWATKKWTKQGFVEAGQHLSRTRGAIIVIMGAKNEKSLCDEISAAIPNSVSMAGRTTLFESAEILAVAELLICNDSGAMHLGAAAGVPIVSVFGPTVLEFGYRPWASNASVVQVPLACRPCGKHGSDICPIGTHECMKKISAADVLAADYSAE